MKPITIQVQGVTKQSTEEICSTLLNLERWPEFEGYSILPGIERAEFETQIPNVVGTRIKVHNKDGSSHVEEIIEWDTSCWVVLKFQDFSPPIKNFATHFIEVWDLKKNNSEVEFRRSMDMHPKGLIGWLVLMPISRLMKKAFEQQATRSNT